MAETVTDGETGLVVPPRDADALRDGLRALLDDPERAGRLGRVAQQQVQERRWSVQAERTVRHLPSCHRGPLRPLRPACSGRMSVGIVAPASERLVQSAVRQLSFESRWRGAREHSGAARGGRRRVCGDRRPRVVDPAVVAVGVAPRRGTGRRRRDRRVDRGRGGRDGSIDVRRRVARPRGPRVRGRGLLLPAPSSPRCFGRACRRVRCSDRAMPGPRRWPSAFRSPPCSSTTDGPALGAVIGLALGQGALRLDWPSTTGAEPPDRCRRLSRGRGAGAGPCPSSGAGAGSSLPVCVAVGFAAVLRGALGRHRRFGSQRPESQRSTPPTAGLDAARGRRHRRCRGTAPRRSQARSSSTRRTASTRGGRSQFARCPIAAQNAARTCGS